MPCEFQYNGPSTCAGSGEFPAYPGVLEKTSCEAGGIEPANTDFLLDDLRFAGAYDEVAETGSPGRLLINDSNGDTHGITIDNSGVFADGFVTNQTPPLIQLNAPGYVTSSFQLTVTVGGVIGTTPITYDASLPEYVGLDSNSLKWKISVDSGGNLDPSEDGEADFGWTDPANAAGACDCLSASIALGSGAKSRKLRLTDFDAGIPSDAEIKAIGLAITAAGSTFQRNGRIQMEAQLLKNGAPSGDRYTFSRNWGEGCLLNADGVTADSGGILGTTLIQMALSSLLARNPSGSWDEGAAAGCETKTVVDGETSAPCTDVFLWNGTWTAADLLDPDFGIEIQAFEASGAGEATGFLDCLQLVIQYTAASENAGEGSLPGWEAEGAGFAPVSGDGDGSLPGLEGEGTGAIELFAQGDGSIPGLEGEGTGAIELFAEGDGSIPGLEGEGLGFIEIFVAGDGSLPGWEGEAAGIGPIAGAIDGSLPGWVAESAGDAQEYIDLPQDPDWGEPVEETTGWLTDILTGYRSLEQRIQLRDLPRSTVRFRLLLTTARQAAAFEAKLWLLRALRVRAPFWPDIAPLTAAANPSDDFLEVETATRRFAGDGLAMLWRDTETYELVEIESVTGSGLELAAGVAGTWPADGHTYVLPVLVGRVEDAPEILRPTSTVAAVDIVLTTEGRAAEEPDWDETFQGFDVLPDEPDRGGDLSLTFERSLHHLDPGPGVTAAWDRAGVPIVRRQNHRMMLDGRAEIARMRGFLARRRGRLVPFWWPTWNSDLQMNANLTAGQSAISVDEIGYADGPFLDEARKRLALIRAAGEIYYREVLEAAAGGGSEALTLDAPIPVNLAKERTLISYLAFLRLADDEIKFLWRNSQFAEVTLDTIELPTEVALETGS